MRGKREQKTNMRGGRLAALALVLAGLILLPTLTHVFDGVEEQPRPPVQETITDTPAVQKESTPTAAEKLPAAESQGGEEATEPETPPAEERPYPDPEKPMIALTFDDGPSAYTADLLDIFKQYGGKGTFFMVGGFIGSQPDAVRRMAEEGHELANHSWSHKDLAKLSSAEIRKEIMRTREKILEITGVESLVVRLPYGSTNKTVRAVAGETQSTLVRWSVDPQDWKYRNADTVYNAVMSRVKDGSIVLLHDIHPTTIEAMRRLAPDLQAAGYQLVTVSQLLEHRYEETAAQIVYPPAPVEEAPAPQQPAEPPAPAVTEPAVQTPAEPAAPTQPQPPAEPAAPTQPQTPVEPAAPAQPQTPAEPAAPAAPESQPAEVPGTGVNPVQEATPPAP